MNWNSVMVKRSGRYYNKLGQRIHNPDAYMNAVIKNKHRYNK